MRATYDVQGLARDCGAGASYRRATISPLGPPSTVQRPRRPGSWGQRRNSMGTPSGSRATITRQPPSLDADSTSSDGTPSPSIDAVSPLPSLQMTIRPVTSRPRTVVSNAQAPAGSNPEGLAPSHATALAIG